MKRRNRWQSFDPTWLGSLESAAGCYVIFAGRRLLYIGQSGNVRLRMNQHGFRNVCGKELMHDGHTTTPWGDRRWADGKITGKVKYANRFGEQHMVEARLIYRLKPAMNQRGLGNGR